MEKLPEASGMLLWGVLIKSVFIIVVVVHFSTSSYDIASVILTLLFSAYCAVHSMVIESVFELFTFLLLSVGTTLWFAAVLAHSSGLLFVLAAAFSLDMLFLLLIVLLPSSVCSGFGYYHFRISAVVRIQAMYHRYQSFVTILKLDTYVTLLFLVRTVEHLGLEPTAVLIYGVGVCSFLWEAFCWQSTRQEEGEELHLLLSLSWVQPMSAVYLMVVLPKVWSHAYFFALCAVVVAVRCACVVSSVRVSANFHKGLLEIHERVESMKLELRSPLPWNAASDPESHLDTELRTNQLLLQPSESDLAIHCSTRYYDTFSSED